MKNILPTPGHSSIISFCGSDVTSLSPELFPSATAAEQHAEDVALYARQLRAQPLRTADFLGADVLLDGQNTYRVSHTYRSIGGYCLANAPDITKPQYVREIGEQLANMPTQAGNNELTTPIVADARYFWINEAGPVFTGFDPALARHTGEQGGEVPGLKAYGVEYRALLASRAGALATLITSGAAKKPTFATKCKGAGALLQHYEELLPDALNAADLDTLGNVLSARFTPKLLRGIGTAVTPSKFTRNPHYIVE